ncbi:MAG: hypothetical protein Q8L98_04910 [Chlamydiales bacterium]|nr:hypothetical protein [Chlamydiales bacterium]
MASKIPSNSSSSVSSSSSSSSAGQNELSREQVIYKRTFSEMTSTETSNPRPIRQLHPLPSSSSSSDEIEDLCSLRLQNPNTAREPKRTKTESLRASSLTVRSSSSSNPFPRNLKQEIPTKLSQKQELPASSLPNQVAPHLTSQSPIATSISLKDKALAAIQVSDYEKAKAIIAQKKIEFQELKCIAEKIFERTPVLSAGALSLIQEIIKISDEKRELLNPIFKGLMNAKTSNPLDQNVVHNLLETLSQNSRLYKDPLIIEAIKQSKLDIASMLLPPGSKYNMGSKDRGTSIKELMKGHIFNADLLKTLLQTTETIPDRDMKIAIKTAAQKNHREALILFKFWTVGKPLSSDTWPEALQYATDPVCRRVIETPFGYSDLEKHFEAFKREFQ